MKLDYLIDTNIFISLFGGLLLEPIPNGKLGYSVITEIELLSYAAVTDTEAEFIKGQLQALSLISLNQDITQKTIFLRRHYQLKIPDSIIVASAWSVGATLITNDQRLIKIPAINILPIPSQ